MNRRQVCRAISAAGTRLLLAPATVTLAQKPRTAAAIFPSNFKPFLVDTSAGATIAGVIGGSGPPVLLLHGAPLTHVSWSTVATALARSFTVVVPDLRGYGDSSKPAGGGDHRAYSKRIMAQDNIDVMKHFGYESFYVAGHDRGGRVAHRMAIDHAAKVRKVAVLDIVPTAKFYGVVTQASATAYWHWFFLIQPAPMPEKALEQNPELMLPEAGDPVLGREYRRVWTPAMIHGMCEDYRAGATIDLQHDRDDNGKKVESPMLALWARQGAIGALFDVLATWRERATNVQGKEIPGGHNLPDLSPKAVTSELEMFFAD